ncbi:MAG: membrane protein insertion efficiency factor YidD [Clostridiales bacterium]|nr:membrane protein insertion efficiency factor YidD [Clostridiales bacterium]MDR2711824.1 membrane protein insertion efficiency factor YidD [Clostridiales bacterium]
MIKKIVLILIVFYRRAISPLFPAHCRYQPTCSQYAIEAIEFYGLRKGGKMACKRILRCHPWGGKGYDPVRTEVGGRRTEDRRG